MSRTENFSIETDPKLACTCGHKDCDKRQVKQHILEMLQYVRDVVNRPVIVNSGGRCPNHIDEVHRDKPADHQKCQGVDVSAKTSVERGEILEAAIEIGFNAIGVYSWGLHLGYRRERLGKSPLVWVK